MKIATCSDGNYDLVSGTCSLVVWSDPPPPSVFSGWTTDAVGQVVGAILVTLAIAYIIRIIHRWVETQ
jgi:hypothetical protein